MFLDFQYLQIMSLSENIQSMIKQQDPFDNSLPDNTAQLSTAF